MKKKILMALMATVITASTFGATSLTAQAADPMVPGVTVAATDNTNAQKVIFSVFDAEYYAKQNPDVVAVVGTDAKALFTHYLTSGIKEGRNASATFNFDAYVSANPDLVTVFGTDDTAIINYVTHFASHAEKEHRIATVEAATAAGITVTTFGDNTKVIAAPTVAGAKYVAPSNGGSSVTVSSGSSYVAPSNGGSSVTVSSGSSYVAPSNGGSYVAPSNGGNTVAPTPAPSTPAPAPQPSAPAQDSGVTYRHYDFETNTWRDGLGD